jgi:hypothetical protein
MLLKPVDLEYFRVVDLYVYHHHLGKQGQDDSRCGESCWSLVAGDVLAVRVQIESDLALDQRVDQQSNHRQHRQRRNPLGFLQPHRGNRRRVLDPAEARFYRGMLFMVRLELTFRTLFRTAEAILAELLVERGAGARYRLCHML